jgi:acetyltransferase-like isoleucine patch superfamily enzyme
MGRFQNIISNIFLDDYSRIRKHLDYWRSRPEVKIHPSVKMGKFSELNIEGECKSLILDEGVSFRKFCQVLLHESAELIIGRNVFFNNYCSVTSLGKITIGDGTIFGESVKIYDHNHKHHFSHEGSLVVNRTEFNIGSVSIGKNCWIGSNVTILKNVEIGDNVIIGAHCLIHKSIPANSIVKHKEELEILKKQSE